MHPATTPLESSRSVPVAGSWSLSKRIAFRFAFAYLVLYNLPFPFGTLPWTGRIAKGFEKLKAAPALWVAKHVLHINRDIPSGPSGSGDKTFDYVLLLCLVVLAVAAAIVWSILDRRRQQYTRLHDWLRVYVRYSLGVIMVGYGMHKVFKLQFPFPYLARLMEPYGDSSPMGLLWTFMGYSTAYTVFSGAAETLGGLLVFFRRTTLLGALVVMAVMTNIVMMNFCYDTPVKLFSSNLLLMCIFLLAPDLKRLASVLVLNRATQPAPPAPEARRPWLRHGRRALQILFVAWIVFVNIKGSLELRKQFGDHAPRPPLYGAYDVEELVKNGMTQPPLLTDSQRWRTVFIDGFRDRVFLTVKTMDGSSRNFAIENNAAKRTLTLTLSKDSCKKSVLAYSVPDENHLTLDGTLLNDSIHVRLRKLDRSKFLLVNRGFHWINEVPFNR